MEIQEERVGDATVVAVAGRLDTNTAGDLETTLLTTLDRGVGGLALDLSGLEFVSSAGLRVLLLVAKRMKAAATPFALYGLQEQVAKVLEISGFAKILPIAGSRDEALTALGVR